MVAAVDRVEGTRSGRQMGWRADETEGRKHRDRRAYALESTRDGEVESSREGEMESWRAHNWRADKGAMRW